MYVPPVNHDVRNMNEASGKDAGARDSLARDRTCLANERTLLAYMRTAIMLLVSGITFVKLFGAAPWLRIGGYLLLPISVVTGLYGYMRYKKMRARIDRSV